MKVFRNVILLSSLFSLFGATAFAQSGEAEGGVPRASGGGTASGGSFPCRITVGTIPFTAVSTAPSAPYSAEREISTVQTLADGTHITDNQPKEKVYRDSHGRMRNETAICRAPGQEPRGKLVEILDPVAGYLYYLDSQRHIAYRYAAQVADPDARGRGQIAAPQQGQVSSAPTGQAGGGQVGSVPPPATNGDVARINALTGNGTPRVTTPRTAPTTESLGSDTIEGVYVEGKRVTSILPAGLAGNDRPITTVSEYWNSPELGLGILQTFSDPRSGVRTVRLTNIDRSEPDPALFQPPPGYQVVDETGPVTLVLTPP